MPHRARPADPRLHRLQGLPRPARARGRPAAHRHPPPRRPARSTPSPSTRRPIRWASSDGFEFDTTTLRFTYSSMTTPTRVYDYDMATRDARAAQGGRDPLRPRPGRLRHPPRLRAGRGRRDGAGLAALPQGHAARRQRALPALRLRRLRHDDPGRRSAPPGCRWSIAASSTPSPISAAARTRAIAGTRTGAARRRSTPSPTSSRRPSI